MIKKSPLENCIHNMFKTMNEGIADDVNKILGIAPKEKEEPSEEETQVEEEPKEEPQEETPSEEPKEEPKEEIKEEPVENNEEKPEIEATEKEISFKEKLKPLVDIANSTMTSINNMFADNCGNSDKYNPFKEEIANFEKTIRGTAKQIISTVTRNKFNVDDNNICSPTAYQAIKQYDSRDRSVIDICGAIIIFYNSIKE